VKTIKSPYRRSMRASCREKGSRSAPLLPTAWAPKQPATRAEEATASRLWLRRSMAPGRAYTPPFSTSERARAPRTELGRRTTPPLKREGVNESTTTRRSLYILPLAFGRAFKRRFTSHGKGGTKWERTGDFYFPGIIGFRLGYSSKSGRPAALFLWVLRVYFIFAEES
jgi:hypothetical protein